jgi:ABC-type transport system involved in cytochrome bd biosynthesis fused ATPase/permease subunit
MMSELRHLLNIKGPGVHVLRTQVPEMLLRASEELVREGEPITVLGPESEFLPGTLRSNFAWDASEVGEYHFGNLMDLIGFDHWRERFGGSLNYRIGPDNQGLSSSEAAALSVARALAQGADTLILVDALAPLSADRQMELLNRLGSANCRILVFSSVSDLWEGDVIELD